MKLSGHFAVFDEWTKIDSWREGTFLERVAPGAFRKTFTENGSRIRALFQHGRDPQMGDKPLGPIETLREDGRGAFYEVDLLDGVPELVVCGLRANLYGASFAFTTIREEYTERPGKSAHNPDGIPERTLRELRLHEFGPVTFPAYQGATSAARSGDEIVLRAIAGRLERLPDRLTGSGSVTLRRLRAEARSSSHARMLVQALERGQTVTLTWGGRGVRGAVARRRSGRPTWALGDRPMPVLSGRVLGRETWRL